MRKLKALWHKIRWLPINYRVVARDVVVGFAALAAATAALQLFYPSDKILPFVEARGVNVGGRSVAEAADILDQRYQEATIVVEAGEYRVEATLAEAGVDIDKTATAKAAADYPVRERLMPFSSLFIMFGRDVPVQARYDEIRLNHFARQIAKQAGVAPVDAGITVEDGKAKLLASKPGEEYPAEKIVQAIREAKLGLTVTVRLEPVEKPAERTDQEVSGVLDAAQRAIDAPLVLVVDGEEVVVDKNTIGGWLDFVEREDGSLRLALKRDAVAGYLQNLQADFYVEPGVTTISMIDGVEVGRDTGEPGRGINIESSLDALAAVIGGSRSRTVELPIAELPPRIVYDRKLSDTSAGLSVLLSSIVQEKGDYGIAVMEVNGRVAKANADKQYTSASTFKLFVAYAVFQWINDGKMDWSDLIVNGKNAEECFDDMIVVSDNPCPAAFADIIGWETINGMVKNLGLKSTQFKQSNHLTTASDLALFLYKLETGGLLSTNDKTRLITAMKGQIYENGIPAGIKGAVVANKPGFYLDLLHDAGIVYGPKGTYILVIMSDNSSWSELADAAKQIHDFLQ